MKEIYQGIYQISQYDEDFNLTTNQYLRLGSMPTLFSTGSSAAANATIPEIDKLLDGKRLEYIFVSHFEDDECGALTAMLEIWQDAKVVCSKYVSAQLKGFGIAARVVEVSSDAPLAGSDFEISFIEYPAGAHLTSGMLAYENRARVFFSSDLMWRAGKSAGEVAISDWSAEVKATGERQVPHKEKLKQLRHDLLRIDPAFIATGHGVCLKLMNR